MAFFEQSWNGFQVAIFFTVCLTLIKAQGDEFQMGRAAGPGPIPINHPHYYLMMPPQPPQQQQHHHHPPAYPNYFNFPPQQDPFFYRNSPQHPLSIPQFEGERDPTIILMPNPTPRPSITQTTATQNENQSSTTAANPAASPVTSTTQPAPEIAQEELQRSGELLGSGGFTNAHHYPFPTGLWTQYKKSIGIDEAQQEIDRDDDDLPPPSSSSSVNPRRFPSILLFPRNRMPFISTRRHFPDWGYGRPHSAVDAGQFPANLLRYSDSVLEPGELFDGRKISPIRDNHYQFFALPLRSVLNQINSDTENERV